MPSIPWLDSSCEMTDKFGICKTKKKKKKTKVVGNVTWRKDKFDPFILLFSSGCYSFEACLDTANLVLYIYAPSLLVKYMYLNNI